MTKYIFVTGGVLSSLGKGLAAAALGALLEARGLTVTFQKLDPYLNVDPGTMNPFQHGEVYVTDDGAETDLDLGHYERFTNAILTQDNNYTSGRIYKSVIDKERRGDYLGKTVQMIPHITDEIKKAVLTMEGRADIIIVEIGGTIGDIEGLPFVESIRQLKVDLDDRCIFIHLTLVPYIKTANEIKTKPTQHSVRELLSYGIQPDLIICRCEKAINKEAIKKISMFCNTLPENVISAPDVKNIYELPIVLHDEGLDNRVCNLLNLDLNTESYFNENMHKWNAVKNKIRMIEKSKNSVTVGIVGKYTQLKEAYKSLHEALFHAGIYNDVSIEFKYIDSEKLENRNCNFLVDVVDCILVPGGFGSRGIEGKINAIKTARVNKIPFFGICLGMQLAVIEYARNVKDMINATSYEFNDNKKDYTFIIDFMNAWMHTDGITTRDELDDMGGTLRLGAYPCILSKESKCYDIYSSSAISERHRHRYEFNHAYVHILEDGDMKITGTSKNQELVEIIELENHPWFIGCQFHPEFKSSLHSPHPLFVSFISAAKEVHASKKMMSYFS